MKKLLLLYILSATAMLATAQDVPRRFLDYKNLLEFRPLYSKHETPGLNIKYLGGKITYVRNILLLDGDGHKDPDIGLSLNPSVTWARFHSEKGEARNMLLQDGLFNFTPSLFLSVVPEPGSNFTLFADITGGAKVFNKLSDIDPIVNDSDNDDGVFEQWVFGLGGGLDFDQKISLHVNYFRGWFDVTRSTRLYYLNYINTTGVSTFVRYLDISANFKLCNSLYASVDWTGYLEKGDERIYRVGIGWQPLAKRHSPAMIRSTHSSQRNTSTTRHYAATDIDQQLEEQVALLRQEFAEYRSDFKKVLNRKDFKLVKSAMKGMEWDLRFVDSKRKMVNWLEKYNEAKIALDTLKTNVIKGKNGETITITTLIQKLPPKRGTKVGNWFRKKSKRLTRRREKF